MSSSTHTAFIGPQYDDEYLGPVQFGPFAQYLAQRLPAGPPGDVLELACGTGLFTRELRARLAPEVKIEKKGVALDVAIDCVAESLKALGGSPCSGHVQGFLVTARAA